VKPLTRAAIIAVGSELLTPLRMDTNSLFITEKLNALGIEVVMKGVAGDDREELAHLFGSARERTDLVVFSGGLGPTDDDVTREVGANARRGRCDDRADACAFCGPRVPRADARDQPATGHGSRRRGGH
jgi:nicotinamide-nucleotide amidase